jgi:hypothetical protein
MLRNGARAEGDASEAATYICWCEWMRRSGDPRVAKIAESARVTLAEMAAEARRLYGDDALARVCACMDELSAKWSRLAIGESFTVAWRYADAATLGARAAVREPRGLRRPHGRP